MKVAVTGGAGYIGSHALVRLTEAGHEPLVIDNLCQGHAEAVRGARSVVLELKEEAQVEQVLKEFGADAVMHFAASASVADSARDPETYYFNNVVTTLGLLRAMRRLGIPRFVFSSSCTVYGIPGAVPITEDFPMQPLSPYGRTKAHIEGILADYALAYGLKYASLRYFNASGAMPDGSLGEDHDPETHLIPLAIRAAMGKRSALEVLGGDYPTPDGTCIRDYVHVLDLASAHVLAMEALDERAPLIYNLSTGCGHSVREVIDAVGEVTGLKVPVVEGARRPGDAPILVGNSERIRRELGWQPQFRGLKEIVETAWEWHRSHPEGFGGGMAAHA